MTTWLMTLLNVFKHLRCYTLPPHESRAHAGTPPRPVPHSPTRILFSDSSSLCALSISRAPNPTETSKATRSTETSEAACSTGSAQVTAVLLHLHPRRRPHRHHQPKPLRPVTQSAFLSPDPEPNHLQGCSKGCCTAVSNIFRWILIA